MNVQQKPAAVKPWPTPEGRNDTPVDPIVLQIVEGTLNSIEAYSLGARVFAWRRQYNNG
jgi:hypothetical protein